MKKDIKDYILLSGLLESKKWIKSKIPKFIFHLNKIQKSIHAKQEICF